MHVDHLTPMPTDTPRFSAMRIALYLAISAQIATLALAIYIFAASLPDHYLYYLPVLQLLIIPYCVLNLRILRAWENRKKTIENEGIDGMAELVSMEKMEVGDEFTQYYIFTLKIESAEDIVQVIDCIDDETYENISNRNIIPIKYIPGTNDTIIRFDDLG